MCAFKNKKRYKNNDWHIIIVVQYKLSVIQYYVVAREQQLTNIFGMYIQYTHSRLSHWHTPNNTRLPLQPIMSRRYSCI